MTKTSAIQSVAPGTVTVIDHNQLSQTNSFSEPLVLRLTNREDQSIHEFEINNEKCLFGSGRHVDVHIPQQGVKEMHCEIIRNPVGIYVRQFDGDILVNGLSLEEAWIFQGDKIEMANIKVEVIEIGRLVLESSISGAEQGQVTRRRAITESKPVATSVTANAVEQRSVVGGNLDWQVTDPSANSEDRPMAVPEASANLLAKIDQAVKQAELDSTTVVKSTSSPKPETGKKKFESVADVVKRMQDAGKREMANEATGDLVLPVAESDREAPSRNAGVDYTNAEDDESVTDYMNQLMQRLKTGEVEVKKEHVEFVDRNADLQTAIKAEEIEEDLTPSNPLLPDEFIPHNVAPEKTSTLDALRQVANQAVETAIDRSVKERSSETSLGYLGAATLCLFLSTVLFMFSAKPFDVAFTAGMLSAVGCVVWTFMYHFANVARDKKSPNRSRKKTSQPGRNQ